MRCLRTILNAPRLPVEFQEVEHIESTGTQYIDTNFIPTVNSKMELVMACMNTSLLQNWSGVTLTAAAGYFRAGSFSDDNLNALFSVGSRQGVLTFPFDNNFHTYYISNGLQKIDNVEAYNTISNFTGQMVNVYLFKGNATYAYNPDDKQRIKSCKLWSGDILVRNFVPCYRKSDSVAGLYDLVNDVFYTNAGTGTFEKGNDVNRVVSSIKSQVAYSILPTEYKQLEYIESTGTQYIDTGKKLTFNDVEIKARISFDNMPSTEQHIISNQNSSSFGFVFGMYSNYLFAFSRSANVNEANATSSSFSGRVDLTIDTKYNSSIAKKQIQVNDTLYNEANFNAQINSSESNIILFRSGETSSRYFTGKLHYLRFYENNVLKFNLIPCYRKSDGEIGLYDRVSGVFYTNAGTGSFTAGGEVDTTIISSNTLKLSTSRLPEAYQEVEYIESSGTQYIDTGIIPSNIGSGFKCLIEMEGTKSGRNGCQRYNYQNTGNYWALCPNFNLSNKITIQFGGAGTEAVVAQNSDTGKHIYGVDVANQKYIYDTTETNGTISITNAIDNFYLFADNYNESATNFVSSKLYSCKFYNNNLVRDFIPCYRKSDDEIGLYDLVNGVFYTNAGTGTFTKGNDI